MQIKVLPFHDIEIQRQLDRNTDLMGMNLSKLWDTVEDRGVCHATVHGVAKSLTWHELVTEQQGCYYRP